ncbi:MAG: hypothetical protein JWQ49_5875 [Edaphobacter sp.]|nr:hypothetical protein [Edaphobacter sp.]
MFTKSMRLCEDSGTKPQIIAAGSLVLLLSQSALCMAGQTPSPGPRPQVWTHRLFQVGGGHLLITIGRETPDLPKGPIEGHLQRAAHAVAVYYGYFPITSA